MAHKLETDAIQDTERRFLTGDLASVQRVQSAMETHRVALNRVLNARKLWASYWLEFQGALLVGEEEQRLRIAEATRSEFPSGNATVVLSSLQRTGIDPDHGLNRLPECRIEAERLGPHSGFLVGHPTGPEGV